MSAARIDAALKRGAAFLASAQLADGSFESYSSSAPRTFQPTKTYKTVFTPAIMLAALNQLPPDMLRPVRNRLATWLLSQKSPDWSFNYWATDEPARKTLPYPDDLDDTFCALIALRGYDASLINEACLGRVVKLLVATESTVGGPYRTWLVVKDAPKTWLDIDLAVNSNIAAFLKTVAEPLPNLTQLLEQAVETGNFASPYYPSPYPVWYYLARAKGGSDPKLVKHILKQRKRGVWPTVLANALAVSSLTQLGEHGACEAAIAYLFKHQQPDGSWPAEAFCLDPIVQGKKYYGGSAALTTALVLEALARYTKTEPTPVKSSRKSSPTDKLYQRIMTSARTELATLDPTLARHALQTLDRVDTRDNAHEITLLPRLFAQNLTSPPKLSTQLHQHLGLANLYGWMAYTVYDDFLDNEGDPQLLPAANVSLRYSLAHFRQALPGHAAFQRIVNQTFDVIDGANAWEVAHCRCSVDATSVTFATLPQYGQAERLAQRSIGHVLAPLGVLAAAGIPVDGPAAKALTNTFNHYLIARQLNDDLHDWEQDLQHGLVPYFARAQNQTRNTSARRPSACHAPAILAPYIVARMRHHHRAYWRRQASRHSQCLASRTQYPHPLARRYRRLGGPHSRRTS